MSTKTLSTLFLVLLFCNVGFAESYYFKECKLSEELSGNYLIDFDKNVIKSTIVRTDGVVQELTDKIKSITKDHIVSEIIQNTKNEKYYLQYSLDANSKSITRQRYIKKHKNDFILPDGPKSLGYCANVKADWEGAEERKQAEIKAEEEKKRIEEKKKAAKLKLKASKKRKEEKENQHNISIIGKKWIKLSKYETDSGKQLENDFNKEASDLCSSTGNFYVLEKKVEVLEMDETPTFGLEPVVKLVINGVIECR